jgi:hypothetical protein
VTILELLILLVLIAVLVIVILTRRKRYDAQQFQNQQSFPGQFPAQPHPMPPGMPPAPYSPSQVPQAQFPPAQFPQAQFPQAQFPQAPYAQPQYGQPQYPQYPQGLYPPGPYGQPPVSQPVPPPAPAPAMPPGYRPQPQDHAVTAANGHQLLLPQFGPGDQAIISVAVVAQGKVYLRAMPNGTGVFGGGLDIVSGRRQSHEDVLTSVRRILDEETGWTGRALATVGHASWDLGSGKENEVCYAVLLDLPPDAPLPAAGLTTWAARSDLPALRDLGPRAQIACDFAGHALSAAGV